jgi:hypothetical protein
MYITQSPRFNDDESVKCLGVSISHNNNIGDDNVTARWACCECKSIYNRTKEKIVRALLVPVEGQTIKILLLCPNVILLSTAHTDKRLYIILSFTTLTKMSNDKFNIYYLFFFFCTLL